MTPLLFSLSCVRRVTGTYCRATSSLSGLFWVWCRLASVSQYGVISNTEEVMQLQETSALRQMNVRAECGCWCCTSPFYTTLVQNWVCRCAEAFGHCFHSSSPELSGEVQGHLVLSPDPQEAGKVHPNVVYMAAQASPASCDPSLFAGRFWFLIQWKMTITESQNGMGWNGP